MPTYNRLDKVLSNYYWDSFKMYRTTEQSFREAQINLLCSKLITRVIEARDKFLIEIRKQEGCKLSALQIDEIERRR